MKTYSVTFVDKYGIFHEFKYDNLEDAIDYAVDVNTYTNFRVYVFKHAELLYKVNDGVLIIAKDL